jgi:hypothetical protein
MVKKGKVPRLSSLAKWAKRPEGGSSGIPRQRSVRIWTARPAGKPVEATLACTRGRTNASAADSVARPLLPPKGRPLIGSARRPDPPEQTRG